MKIRTQFIATLILFGVILIALTVSVTRASRKLKLLDDQQNVVDAIVRGINDLDYLAGEYLLHGERQQQIRWKSKFSRVMRDLGYLEAPRPEQQMLLKNMRDNLARLDAVFDDVAARREHMAATPRFPEEEELVKVLWSRMSLQNQVIHFDALDFRQQVHAQGHKVRKTREVMIFVLMGVFGASLASFYIVTYRRALQAISALQAGTRIVGSGNLNYTIPVKRDDEITDLTRAFNRMTADLKEVTASKSAYERELADRRRAEEELRLAYSRMRTFFDHRIGGIGIVISRADGTVLSANDYYLNIIGYTREDLLAGKIQWRKITPPEWLPADETGLAQLKERGVSEAYEKEYIRRDGTRVPVLLTTAKLPGGIGEILVFVIDMTARKRAEKELRELNASLEQRVAERTAEAEHLTGQLRALASDLSQTEQRERKRLGAILHDHVQQLLVAALMQLGMMQRADQAARDAVGQEMETILKEAIAASRSLAVELSPPVLHQGGLAAALGWLAARVNDQHRFKVHVHADSDAEPADENARFLLFESVRELLLNSIKHSGVNEARVAMTRPDGGGTRIVVEDQGKGFDMSALRGQETDVGTLGLFSLQQRLVYLGGRIEVESAPGQGTRATLWMPPQKAAPPAEEPLAAAHVAAPTVAPRPPKGGVIRVLLVDDHKIMRQGLVSLLQLEPDIEVVAEAGDGQEAIDLARAHKPDVIIMDINLPVMDGIKATRIIAGELPQTKVVGLSMHIDPGVGAAMRRAGAVAYLTKGGPSEDLVTAIRQYGPKP